MQEFNKGAAVLAAFPVFLAAWVYSGSNTPGASVRPAFSEVTITMDGNSERPKQTTSNSTGSAKFTWTATSPISYRITVKALTGVPTAAHIHGPANSEGTAGPIVTFKLDSVVPNGTIAVGSIDSTMSKVPLDSLKKLMNNGNAYVNVHTAKYPAGEIRGQFKGENNRNRETEKPRNREDMRREDLNG